MASIRLKIKDVGGRDYQVEVPGDEPLGAILEELLAELRQRGSSVIADYALYHTDQELPLDSTLQRAGVRDGDTLVLVPKAAAGGGPDISYQRDDVPVLLSLQNIVSPALGTARFEITGFWTAVEFSQWLQGIDQAYIRLQLFFSDDIPDEGLRLEPTRLMMLRTARPDHERLEALVAVARRRFSPLRIGRIQLASPGFIELIGSLNPLKLIADFIIAWRHENTIRDQNHQQADLDRLKVKADLAKAILDREGALRAHAPDDKFVDRFIQFALDEPRRTIEDVAKDLRLREVSASESAPHQPERPGGGPPQAPVAN